MLYIFWQISSSLSSPTPCPFSYHCLSPHPFKIMNDKKRTTFRIHEQFFWCFFFKHKEGIEERLYFNIKYNKNGLICLYFSVWKIALMTSNGEDKSKQAQQLRMRIRIRMSRKTMNKILFMKISTSNHFFILSCTLLLMLLFLLL